MRKLIHKFENIINDFNIKKKLLLLFICCVLLPLFLTDSVILFIILSEEKKEQNYEMRNIASAVQYDYSNTFDDAVNIITSIYMDKSMDAFLETEFESNLDYFTKMRMLTKDTYFETSLGSSRIYVVMYGDNDTIVNGGHFARLSGVREEEWYKSYQESDNNLKLCFFYVGDKDPSASSRRRACMVGNLNFFKTSKCEKVIKLDIDYIELSRKLENMKYSFPVYICDGDRILFSNDGHSNCVLDFDYLTGDEKIGYEQTWKLYGDELRILVMEPEKNILSIISDDLPLILFMIAINVLLPCVLMMIINHSFTRRLRALSQAFDEAEAESLKEIEHVQGKDEIGNLMRNYNLMVRRSQELIKTVYKDRLERQEIDIARQNAELLALHSQINPHFLFNVLESIRMHCILKKEEETASMIERLAVLERQNVDWSTDLVAIQEEMNFIRAYLDLQKYRFGDRLTYKIDIAEGCADYLLPRLTLVTFVENACVHGVEKKSVPCWVDIRVYEKENLLYLEIEDTGGGMEDDVVERLLHKMQNCTIDTLKDNEHVGMINACLRLKMVTQQKVKFELESEVGIGTYISIIIPTEVLEHSRTEALVENEDESTVG
ncbi:MAG TPA: histidine kinase [Lachnospiraceae bacterium]|nr:histidine kinase [Lachnospiraceae bacterium]